MTQNYVPAKHLEYIQRPTGIPITLGYPSIESDYSGGPHLSESIITAILDFADPRFGVIAPNVSTRLFVYKDLFNLYKPFHELCSTRGRSSGRSNSHIVSTLKQYGYIPFKTEDENIPDVWIKAGELARYNKDPDMVLPILERIAENPTDIIEDKINTYLRNYDYAPPSTLEEFSTNIAKLTQNSEYLKAANQLLHRHFEAQRHKIIKAMSDHLLLQKT